MEVRCGDDILILDAGSGLQLLGEDLMRRLGRAKGTAAKKLKKLHLFFTHCHYDHISGFPFFAPFFNPEFTVDVWSGHLEGPDKTRNMIESYMKPPFFPVGPDVFSAELAYRDFEPRGHAEAGSRGDDLDHVAQPSRRIASATASISTGGLSATSPTRPIFPASRTPGSSKCAATPI